MGGAVLPVLAGMLARMTTPYAVYQPKRIKGNAEMRLGDRMEVAGVSFHQAEIRKALRAVGETLWAVLEWETNNPHDRWAVRVSLAVNGNLLPVGHIPAAHNEQLAGVVAGAAKKGLRTVVDAEIEDGWSDKVKHTVMLGQRPSMRLP